MPLSRSDIAVRLLAVLILIALNAFFVAAEFSIVSVRRSRINQLVSGGDVQAKTVQSLQQSLDRLLSTTQLGITLSSLALGWIGEGTVAFVLSVWLSQLPLSPQINQFLSHSAALPLAFILVAYLQIVLGELCPKSLALRYPEKIARIIGPTSLSISRLFTPFIWVLNLSTRCLLGLMGIKNAARSFSQLTPEELQLIISTDTETPDLDKGQREILNNIFEFRDVTVAEIMVPRTQIQALSKDASFQDLLNEMAASGYSRYPVMGDSLDDICGIIHFKELAKPLSKNQLRPNTPILPWVKPARFVPDSLQLDELLGRMQQLNHVMMIVVDDFGGTAGLITLEAVTAEIIGDGQPATLTSEACLIQRDGGTISVTAQLNIETINEQLNLDLPITEDYQTLAGFVIYQLQKIPNPGDTLNYEHRLEFIVTKMQGPKIEEIQIIRLQNSASPSDIIDAPHPEVGRLSHPPLRDPLTDS